MDRRFDVFHDFYRGISMETRSAGTRLPCIEIRQIGSLGGIGLDIGAAFRVAKRLAGWRGEVPEKGIDARFLNAPLEEIRAEIDRRREARR